ncbi:PilN domain-containing protein [Desulforhopalus singaporensis]|uniref:Type IV pilus assembly protein PilN n=1 Tax=Desulforhopalus singaporensis TaxID=91360 RepID=A0A1H0SE37_9BACT|nr:PilN domain-containing protein [Desulforhopalus singaporensis]SDP39935.1 type IV pilus assembly protein PilN [Desulforhopalus singaporensis]
MLKINLLPIKQIKKRAKARKQFLGMILLFLMVCGLLAGTGYLQARKISSIRTQIAALNAEKNSYASTLKKIEQLKKDKQELERRTQVINKLKTDSSLTVRVIDEVANRIDNERMWLTSFQQQGGSLSLAGVALDNQTIAQFMDNLKESPFVRDVSLANSSLKNVSGRNLKSFSLSCAVSQPAEQTPENVAAK